MAILRVLPPAAKYLKKLKDKKLKALYKTQLTRFSKILPLEKKRPEI